MRIAPLRFSTLRRVKPLSCAVFCGVLFSTLLSSSGARADVSSWLYLGAGPSWIDQDNEPLTSQPSLQIDTGLGTPPSRDIILGGLLRLHTHFGRGTDAGLLLRTATHGFVNGQWGAAIDLGGYQRWWEEGSTGLLGTLTLGAPWGITLSAGGGYGTNGSRFATATLGIDLARLTVYRRSGDSWWKNTFPAYRPERE